MGMRSQTPRYRIAGYHVYFLPSQVTSPKELAIEPLGPVIRSGEPLVAPRDVDVRAPEVGFWFANLEGRYVLVPVDARGHEMWLHLELDARGSGAVDLAAYARDAVPHLCALLADPDLELAAYQALLPDQRRVAFLDAIARAVTTSPWWRHPPETPLERDHELEQIARSALGILRRDAESASTPHARPLQLDRRSLRQLTAAGRSPTLLQMRAAIDRGDDVGAAIQALVRLRRGLALPAQIAVHIVTGLDDLRVGLGLLGLAGGDRHFEAIDALACECAPSMDHVAILAYAAWRTVGDAGQGQAANRRQWLRPFLRRVAQARDVLPEVRQLVAQVVAEVDDPSVSSRAVAGAATGEPAADAELPDGGWERWFGASAERIVKALPDQAPPAVHERDPRLVATDVGALCPSELVHLHLDGLDEAAVIEVIDAYVSWRRWNLADAAVDHLASRAAPGVDIDALRVHMVDRALCMRCHVSALRLAGKIDPSVRVPRDLSTPLVLGAPKALGRLRDHLRILDAEDPEQAATLAVRLVGSSPAIAVVVARACLGPGYAPDELLEAIDVARERLDLRAGDPARAVAAELACADEGARMTLALRTELDEALAVAGALEAARDEAMAEARELRHKNEQLEGILREGDRERAALRERLAGLPAEGGVAADEDVARDREAGDGTTEDRAAADEDLVAPLDAPPPRAIRTPRFAAPAAEALRAAPSPVAAGALRCVARLAGGDAAAWRDVMQARDTPRPVLMTRVDGHHHVLVALMEDEGALEVLDLVRLESVPAALARLRAC